MELLVRWFVDGVLALKFWQLVRWNLELRSMFFFPGHVLNDVDMKTMDDHVLSGGYK